MCCFRWHKTFHFLEYMFVSVRICFKCVFNVRSHTWTICYLYWMCEIARKCRRLVLCIGDSPRRCIILSSIASPGGVTCNMWTLCFFVGRFFFASSTWLKRVAWGAVWRRLEILFTCSITPQSVLEPTLWISTQIVWSLVERCGIRTLYVRIVSLR